MCDIYGGHSVGLGFINIKFGVLLATSLPMMPQVGLKFLECRVGVVIVFNYSLHE